MLSNEVSYAIKADGGGGRAGSLVYDPATGTWVTATPTNTEGQTSNSTSQTTGSVPESNPKSEVDSKTAAEKEFIEVEFNTLVGELGLTSTAKSIRIKVNDTVKVEGVGKYLSGQYFVSAIRRTLNKDNGYTHTLTLIKNGFGNSLKKPEPVVESPRKEEVKKETPAIKVGDSVKIVGDNAVYSNAHDGVKVPAWVKKKNLTIDAVSADGTRVRLMPIWSWTYIKYIQKL